MRVLAILFALYTVAESAIFRQFYPFDRENDHQVPTGSDASSALFRLNVPAVFYDNVFDGVSVHTDGFVTFGVIDGEDEQATKATLAPFMFDLDSTNGGEIYYQELNDEGTLGRATGDIRTAFEETASNFEAASVFVATWVRLQSPEHPATNFSFQCVVVSDGLSSYAIFLYPADELATGETADTIRNQLTARAGFSDTGDDQLEVLSATELLEGGNAQSPGKWIFQIGGVLLTLEGDKNVPSHHVKAEPVHHRRQSGFEVSEVNFNEDYNPSAPDCDDLQCDAEHSSCVPFTDGYCCQCDDGFFGNGASCLKMDDDVRYNGHADGFAIVMNPDNSWSNESAPSVDVHSYVVTKDGRAYSVLNGEISATLIRALQPMAIFGTTLGWIFASSTAPAVNGFQFSGGKVTSETYIRYTTGAYEFRIRQEYDQVVDSAEGDGKVLNGRMTFNGRLPAVEEKAKISVGDYTQIYMKTGLGSIRSRDTRSYVVGDVTHSYTVDQSIKFDSCEASFEEVPQNLAVDVSGVFIEYFEDEKSLRYAMNSHIRPADEVGVRPSEPTPAPTPDTTETPVETEVPVTFTLCQRQLAEARRIQEESPLSTEQLFFPTCTELGTFAPRQCQAYDSVCWCVDQDSGVEIEGTRTEPLEGYGLDCSDVEAPPPEQTPCQEDRSNAERERIAAGSEANSIFMPRCMESGAYEPVQQLPDGSFMCVDFDGEELYRSTEKPDCLTPCQLDAYIAKSSNIFLETDLFEVRCQADGEYAAKQCVDTYCYCVDKNGFEISNSRVETTIYGEDVDLDCDKFTRPSGIGDPVLPPTVEPTTTSTTTTTTTTTTTRPEPRPAAGRLIFAQSMGINAIDLPVTRDNSVSKRLFASSDQTAIALAYDCARETYYWTDLSKRRIYSSEINSNGVRNLVLNSRIRSPEGIAVDFTTGNIYWTDSEYDRIEVASADGSNRMTLVTGDLVNPRGIAVDPIRGRMYWTDWNRAAPKIWMADMNGANKRVLVSENLGLPNDITIDFYRQKVCFVDAGTFKIECMNLDGQGRQTIYQMGQVPRPHPFGFAVDGDVLYYSSWKGSKAVHAVNWRTGDHIPIAAPRGAHGQMYGVEIVHANCPRGYSQCSFNNGGCSHLCLPTPTGRECKCPPGATDCQ